MEAVPRSDPDLRQKRPRRYLNKGQSEVISDSLPAEDDEDSDEFVNNAIIVACIIGIVMVAALIVLTPRRREPFSQLWLKPHKLKLTNASADDENVKRILRSRNVSVYNSSFLGNPFYVFSYTEGDPMAWFPMDEGLWNPRKTGSTFSVGPNSLFLDAVDLDGGQILFWEYPRGLFQDNSTRFAFVIENNMGRDHDYRTSIILANGDENVTKAIIDVPVKDSERKTVAVQVQLTDEEAQEARALNYTKVIVRLDTAEEVFFWIGGSIR